MYKKMMVVAISVGLGMPVVAHAAGVEVYGQARMSLDFNTNNDPVVGNEDSALAVSSNASRLGFRGNEDLGNGLKLLWQFEQQVDFDTGTFGSGPRTTFVGLGGNFGMLAVGKNESPLRVVTQRLDVFSDTKADYNAIIGNVGGARIFDQRSNNTLLYTAPDMQGFGFAAAYAASIQDDDLPVTQTDGDKDLVSVSGSYSNGPLYVGMAFESLGNYTGTDAATAFRLGGSWTFASATTLAGIWESADKGGTNGDRDAWYVSVAHKMGGHTLKAAVAGAGEVGGVADTGAVQYSLGIAHELSKSTEMYALYTVVDNNTNGTYGVWSGSQTIAGFANESVSSLSVGVNHKFSSK